MTPIELKARREALGLSQSALAGMLDVAQNTVSQWEGGQRRVPDGIDAELAACEDLVEEFVDLTLRHVTRNPGSDFVSTHATDTAMWAAQPQLEGKAAVLHRVAMARAATILRRDYHPVAIVDWSHADFADTP
jgi:transcriptional regulator with XRE-family HTH domain